MMRVFLLFIGWTLTAIMAQMPTLDEMMQGKDFIGHWPENVQWSPDAQHILFEQKAPDANITKLYAYNIHQKSRRIANQKEYHLFFANQKFEFYFNTPKVPANKGLIYQYENTIYIKDQLALEAKTLFTWPSRIQNFSQIDDHHYIFLSNETLYTFSTHPLQIHAILSPQKTEEVFDTSLWSKEARPFVHELEMRELQNNENKSFLAQYDTKTAKYQLPNGEILSQLFKSPQGPYYLVQTQKESSYNATQMMDFVNLEGVTEPYQARAKVGSMPLHEDYLYLYHADTLVKQISKEGLPKEQYIHLHQYNPNTQQIPIEFKSSNNHHRALALVHLKTGEITWVDHQEDPAWIGGPGISGWNMQPGNIFWNGDDQLCFQSEKTGYSHLYSLQKGKIKALTQGNYEVRSAQWNTDQNQYDLTLNKIHPGVRNTYTLKEGRITGISEGFFGIEETIAPNGRGKYIKISSRNQPPQIYYVHDGDSNLVNFPYLTKAFQQFAKCTPKVENIHRNGLKARVYYPENSNGKAVIFVHGAGYLQNAHYYWSGYYHEFLFHQKLVQEGYTIIDPDYAASDGYGRDWRTSIYLNMGGADLESILHSRTYLIEEGIDSTKIGIYGGSYGGFMTLMALFKHPGKFAAGAALRSVTDWTHYNDPYTSNILGRPQDQPDAYRKSSPIYYAKNLSDPLLMCHGLMDDNVQVQDIFRLSQHLIELKKENWELAIYPIEPHGFKTASSWHDEYRRIYELFKQHL